MTDDLQNPDASRASKQAGSYSLSFTYDPRADRILLAVTLASGDEQRRRLLLMTRRLTGRLVDGLAQLLEKTSPVAAQAPADVRDDIILFEHQDAVGSGADEQPGAGQGAARPLPPGSTSNAGAAAVLLDTVDVTVKPTRFDLTFKAGQDALSISVSRAELHRLVEVLSRQAAHAAWNLAPETAWLSRLGVGPETASLTVN